MLVAPFPFSFVLIPTFNYCDAILNSTALHLLIWYLTSFPAMLEIAPFLNHSTLILYFRSIGSQIMFVLFFDPCFLWDILPV